MDEEKRTASPRTKNPTLHLKQEFQHRSSRERNCHNTAPEPVNRTFIVQQTVEETSLDKANHALRTLRFSLCCFVRLNTAYNKVCAAQLTRAIALRLVFLSLGNQMLSQEKPNIQASSKLLLNIKLTPPNFNPYNHLIQN